MGTEDTTSGGGDRSSERLRLIVIGTISALWVVSVLASIGAQIIGYSYTAPTELNTAGAAVIMFMLSERYVLSHRRGGSGGDSNTSGGASGGGSR